jgi:hypothetical protein
MKPSLVRILLVAPTVLLASALSGCGDDFGQACDMPNTPQFNALCAADPETGSDATCVFTNNPQCSSRTCARFQGSSDFCTELCNPTASECPGDAICYAQPGRPSQGFCVPAAIFQLAGS